MYVATSNVLKQTGRGRQLGLFPQPVLWVLQLICMYMRRILRTLFCTGHSVSRNSSVKNQQGNLKNSPTPSPSCEYCDILRTRASMQPLFTDLDVHIQIPPSGYIGLIWRSTTEATASQSTAKDTLQLLRQSTVHSVAAVYPRSTINGTPTRNSLSSTAS